MALYFGKNRVKINLDRNVYYLNLFPIMPITTGIRLLSSEGYILRDSNGLYLTTKESE